MPYYVVPAIDLALLNDLPDDYPRPVGLEWIDRGTDKPLRRMTVLQLIRTLYSPHSLSDGVRKLHQSAGLRIRFESERDQVRFRAMFDRLRRVANGERQQAE